MERIQIKNETSIRISSKKVTLNSTSINLSNQKENKTVNASLIQLENSIDEVSDYQDISGSKSGEYKQKKMDVFLLYFQVLPIMLIIGYIIFRRNLSIIAFFNSDNRFRFKSF